MNAIDGSAETMVLAVYVSCATSLMKKAELAKLLQFSRENNKRRRITGMLLYRNGDFMQVIEGPTSSVDALLKSLARDPRHTGMIVLLKMEISDRQFSQWQMAFRDLSNTDLKKMEGYSLFMDWSFNSQEFQAAPDLAHRLLLQFKERLL